VRVNHKIVDVVDAQVRQASGSLVELLARRFEGLRAEAVVHEDCEQLGYAIPKQIGDLVGHVARLDALSAHQLYDKRRKPKSARDRSPISGKDREWNAPVEEAAIGHEVTIVVTHVGRFTVEERFAELAQDTDSLQDL